MSNVEAFARAARMVQMFGASAEQVAQAFEFFGQHEGAPMREQITCHSKVFMWRDVLEVIEGKPRVASRHAGASQGAAMSDIPKYTSEQKAAAFDALWSACGNGPGTIHAYKNKDISRPGCPPNEATFLRVPVYHFTVAFDGEAPRFKDVLHHLATHSVSHFGK